MCELLSNNSLFIGLVYEDKSLALRACDLIFIPTDLQTVIIIQQFTARADLFLNLSHSLIMYTQLWCEEGRD